MTFLESLPAPLPLFIAKDLTDLRALDALRQSSVLFVAVFARHAVELLEHLMLATLHEQLILELRAHVLLMADFDRRRHTDMAVERLYKDANDPLLRNMPVEAVSLTLRTSSFLHSLGGQVNSKNYMHCRVYTPTQDLRTFPSSIGQSKYPTMYPILRLSTGPKRRESFRASFKSASTHC